ncbi:MAG: cell wall hydrolase [Mesorhizobium sp.]|uniref:cell wall hydrolase n=1 Tax=unclassified Mesorhizobium TaxID=325217 RepID=UPI000FCA1B8B|nr:MULTISPECIES: cell wall hydrolase [unclassified Mesorhizobium]RUW04054.1 cell wall hydrolase [Mesorhizobium sp. M1A.F.Ca.IN.020.04.1.1]RUW04117.1 cell wall hydrolase [Mesorhizobium sp. M1A.F.Ca.IN.020.04.1.1]TIN82747.1 MAG: cell wall hydrolase [Mesorhizobium sp.]TIN88333.1 MAG: cell wall hydrolase [Mesorhizobium sp.]
MAYVGTPNYLGNDLETLASILQGEAGGEGLLGMQAVADVIRNRANQNFSGYGSSPVAQALARNQFQGQSTKIGPDARNVASQLISGQLPDVAGNALYYANPGASTASWARNLNSSNAMKIGNHYFTDNAKGVPFAAPSPYAALPDGPKGQESYPAPGLAPATQSPGGLLANHDTSVPADVAAYASSGDTKSPLQGFFSALAQTPDAPPVRFKPMGDARQTGNSLLKQLQATPISDILLKQRLLG